MNKRVSRVVAHANAWPWILVFCISSLFVLVASIIFIWTPIYGGDTGVYRSYSAAIWGGNMPYKDFFIEYLPGVLPFIILAQPVGILLGNYTLGFMLLSSLAVILFLYDRYRQVGQQAAAISALILVPVLAYVIFQLDVFAALALYGALRALRGGRLDVSAIFLVCSLLIKGYPLICLPVILMAIPRFKRLRYLFITALGLVAGMLPFMLASPSGVWHAFQYHSERPLEIVSGPAAVGFVFHFLGQAAQIGVSHKSWSLHFPMEDTVGVASVVLLLLGLIATMVIYRRYGYRKPATACLAALLVFVLTFKVGSPQFLVPVFFLATLAADEIPRPIRWQLWLRLLLVGIAVLAILLNYRGLITMHSFAGALVVLRTILTAELLIWVLRNLRSDKQLMTKLPKNTL